MRVPCCRPEAFGSPSDFGWPFLAIVFEDGRSKKKSGMKEMKLKQSNMRLHHRRMTAIVID
jgi:hypothetical protein